MCIIISIMLNYGTTEEIQMLFTREHKTFPHLKCPREFISFLKFLYSIFLYFFVCFIVSLSSSCSFLFNQKRLLLPRCVCFVCIVHTAVKRRNDADDTHLS
jgi:hypothetical protein